MGYVLRDVQSECLDAMFQEIANGRRSMLVVAPTGFGKTVLFSFAIQRWLRSTQYQGRALVLVHREELAIQAREKIEVIADTRVEMEMGEFRVDRHSLMFGSEAIVASVQSLCRPNRLMKYDPADFGLLIVDEAHHCVPKCKTYAAILKHFQQNPELVTAGVTATPDRADEEALGQVFETVAYDYSLLDAIHDGYLVPIRQRMVIVEGLDYSSIRTTAGDLNGADLDAVMREEKIAQGVVDATRQIAAGRPTLVFAASVAHAHMMAEILNRHQAGCAVALDGESDKDIRRTELLRFKKRDYQFLVGCGLFTEGFDSPGIEVVSIARPTKSRALYAQMIGRGTRTLPGVIDDPAMDREARLEAIAGSRKPHVTVIDFSGNAGRHKLVTTADVLGGKCSDEIVERVKAKAAAAGKQELDTDTLADILAAQRERDEKRRREREKIVAQARFHVREIDPFDLFDLNARREPGYLRGKPASDKQLEWLRRNKVRVQGKLSMHKAGVLIEEVKKRGEKGLCTPQQAHLLKRFGYPVNVTQEQARQYIAEINSMIARQKEGVPA